jgi:hypothetical protein
MMTFIGEGIYWLNGARASQGKFFYDTLALLILGSWQDI